MILSSALIILGWFVGHMHVSKREFKNKRREVRVQYLMEAYRRIASAADRKERTTDAQKLNMESAIGDIQLLGNERQIRVIEDMKTNQDDNFNEVLEVLRDDLRTELELPPVSGPIKFFRMNRD